MKLRWLRSMIDAEVCTAQWHVTKGQINPAIT